MYNVPFTMYNVQCTIYYLQCTIFTMYVELIEVEVAVGVIVVINIICVAAVEGV